MQRYGKYTLTKAEKLQYGLLIIVMTWNPMTGVLFRNMNSHRSIGSADRPVSWEVMLLKFVPVADRLDGSILLNVLKV
jgi:hypothetical protein